MFKKIGDATPITEIIVGKDLDDDAKKSLDKFIKEEAEKLEKETNDKLGKNN